MSQLRIVAVGGSGQHAALAMTRLAAIGAFPRAQCLVIDADADSEMSKDLMSAGVTGGRPSDHPLEGAHQIHKPLALSAAGNTTFAQYMLEGATDPLQRDVFEALFSAVQGDVKIAEGMYGNPAVGATVFLGGDGRGPIGVVQGFAPGDDVVIVGSFVGGTGSGIMHELARAAPASCNRYGVFYLPWFRAGGSSGAGSVGADTHDRNMKHGVDHLRHETMRALHKAALIGLPDSAAGIMKKPEPQQKETHEIPHLVHVAAAYAALALGKAKRVDAHPSILGFAYEDGAERRLLLDELQWEGGRPLRKHIERAKEIVARLDHIVGPADSGGEFAEHCEKWAKKAFMAKGQDMPPAFKETIEEHVAKQRARSRGDDTAITLQLVGDVFARMRQLRDQLRFALRYLEDESVCGSVPTAHTATKYSVAMIELKARWTKGLPVGEDAAGWPSAIARHFLEQLVPLTPTT